VFWAKSAQTAEKMGDAFSVFCKRAKERGKSAKEVHAHIGNPDGYQKKGVAGVAKGIVIKTNEIGKVAGS